MRILLLGATGNTGQPTLTEALSRSYTVTALVRRPDAISQREGLKLIQGTPESKADILKAFESAPSSDPIRAVVSALGNGNVSDFPFRYPGAPRRFMEECARDCIAVMKEKGCKKIVWMGTCGVGSSMGSVAWIIRWICEYSLGI